MAMRYYHCPQRKATVCIRAENKAAATSILFCDKCADRSCNGPAEIQAYRLDSSVYEAVQAYKRDLEAEVEVEE
jgi:protein-arginine kinase activator protein McsA